MSVHIFVCCVLEAESPVTRQHETSHHTPIWGDLRAYHEKMEPRLITEDNMIQSIVLS